MSLLQEIQNSAVISKEPLTDLLRKCKVLAARLDNQELKSWVDNELNGYRVREDLPDYRIIQVMSFGDFSGMFGSGLKNAPIPPMTLPEIAREFAGTAHITQPISSLFELEHSNIGEALQLMWPPDMVAVVASRIYERMNCLSAWLLLSPGTITGILDTVRNRILNFALEMEADAPDAGESFGDDAAISPERVTQMFTNNIYGNVGNISSGSQDVSQTAVVEISNGDMEGLKKYLSDLKVITEDITELETALSKDKGNNGHKHLGERTQAWLGKMVAKASSGAWQASTSSAADILTKAISQYLGLQ